MGSSRHRSAIVALACIGLSLPACVVSVRSRFSPTVTQGLVLRQTTETEAVALLGEHPKIDRKVLGNNHVTLSYVGTETHLSGLVVQVSTRLLDLEFVDGRLNAYEVSAVDQTPPSDAVLGEALQLDAAPDAVTAWLGPPTGRAVCPSSFFRDCTEGEWWTYRSESAQASIQFDAGQRARRISISRRAGERDIFVSGFPFSPAESWIVVGETSLAELIGHLGLAPSEMWESDGKKSLEYSQMSLANPGRVKAGVVALGALMLAAGVTHASALSDRLSIIVLDPKIQIRVVGFDFQDGLLQGFQFLSNAADDQTPLPDPALLTLGLTKSEVEQRVGRRHTEVICPSSMIAECQSGSAWIWMLLPELGAEESSKATKPRGLALFFDQQGTLQVIKPLPPSSTMP